MIAVKVEATKLYNWCKRESYQTLWLMLAWKLPNLLIDISIEATKLID